MDGINPLIQIGFVGLGLMRAATLVLPTRRVQAMLAPGMRLREQQLTPHGTHPVILFFYQMFQAHTTIPTLLPELTYCEQIIGVPYTDLTGEPPNVFAGGPFFFMPQLFLSDVIAWWVGRVSCGFAKNLARITADDRRYEVRALDGRPLITLDSLPTGGYHPVDRYPKLVPVQKAIDQKIVSQMPLGIGPWFVASDFVRYWWGAQMRPISTVVHIAEELVPGLPAGRFPCHGRTPGIDVDVLGSYEFSTGWSQSFIYPTWYATG
jgi:hypothetical protein